MDRSRPGWKHFWRQNGWKKPSELALFNCRAPSWLVSLIYIYIDLFIDVYIYIYLLSLFGVLFLTLILLLVGSICVILRAFLRAEGRGGGRGMLLWHFDLCLYNYTAWGLAIHRPGLPVVVHFSASADELQWVSLVFRRGRVRLRPIQHPSQLRVDRLITFRRCSAALPNRMIFNRLVMEAGRG